MRPVLESLVHRNHRTVAWSGGSTTELAIYPLTADYKQGNYLWRLSTATVEAETSVFSSLPGIARTLMLLEGQMSLRHEGHHEKDLRPFDQDSFDGGWTTHSRGQARDFNLMCASGVEGELAACHVRGRDAHRESLRELRETCPSWLALYSVDGDLNLRYEGEQTLLQRGDILVTEASLLESEGEFVVENPVDQTSVLIRCVIRSSVSSSY